MKVHVATDHSGFEFKNELKDRLENAGFEVEDHGAHELDPADDYTDFVIPAAKAVAKEVGSFGIVIGRSGQGEAMAANKIHGARACVYYGSKLPIEAVDADGKTSEDPLIIMEQTRKHNHANILSLGFSYLTVNEAVEAFKRFAETDPEPGRHQRRVDALEDAGREQ